MTRVEELRAMGWGLHDAKRQALKEDLQERLASACSVEELRDILGALVEEVLP